MVAPRRTAWLFLLALPVWLAMALPLWGQTLTADVNGDGVSDRIGVARTAGELVVEVSGRGPAQRLRTTGAVLELVVADIDHDGDSDLVAMTAGRRHIRLLVWTNAGDGQFVSRPPTGRAGSSGVRRARVGSATDVPVLDDLAGDSSWLAAQPVLALPPLAARALRLHGDDALLSTRPRNLPRAPRGPPVLPLLP